VGVATMGSASRDIPGRAVDFLLPLATIYAAYDDDDEGQKGLARLLSASERIESLFVPAGKDVTDFWRLGGDLRAWLRAAVAIAEAPPVVVVDPRTVESFPMNEAPPAGTVCAACAEAGWTEMATKYGPDGRPYCEADWESECEYAAEVVQRAGQMLPQETPWAQESGANTFSSHSTSSVGTVGA
jgi:hypothetical protein